MEEGHVGRRARDAVEGGCCGGGCYDREVPAAGRGVRLKGSGRGAAEPEHAAPRGTQPRRIPRPTDS
eukprot:1482243-Rhodomonas_salina.1